MSHYVKTAISLKPSLFEALVDEARSRRLSCSQVLAQALEEHLSRRDNRALLEELNAVYAEEPDEDDQAWLAFAKEQIRRILAKEDAEEQTS
jgi:hypothetical protein